MIKQQPYIESVARCVASLHINALRSASNPSAWTRNLASSPSSNGGSGRGRLTYAGAIISHSSEAPEVFEAYKQLAIALSAFRAEVTKLDCSNWVNCGTFAIGVLVFRLDHARRAPAGDLQAIVIDPLHALRTTTAMADQILAFLPLAHRDKLGGTGSVVQRPVRPRIVEGPAQLKETLGRMDVLLRRVEGEVGQEAVLPSFQHAVPPALVRQSTAATGSSGNDNNNNNRISGSCSSSSIPSHGGGGGHQNKEQQPPSDARLRAAAALRAWTEHVAGRPRAWIHLISAMSWSSHISEDFISLVLEEEPTALMITLYWLVIVNRTAKRWYLEGWAKKAAMTILEKIGPGWEDMVAWPMAEMELCSSGGGAATSPSGGDSNDNNNSNINIDRIGGGGGRPDVYT